MKNEKWKEELSGICFGLDTSKAESDSVEITLLALISDIIKQTRTDTLRQVLPKKE